MSEKEQVVPVHPEGEVQTTGGQSPQNTSSLDTFAGKIDVKWSAEAPVSSLGLMPFFIEFLKTSGLFDTWVEECPLTYNSSNAPNKRDVLGTILLSVLAGHWRCPQELDPERWYQSSVTGNESRDERGLGAAWTDRHE